MFISLCETRYAISCLILFSYKYFFYFLKPKKQYKNFDLCSMITFHILKPINKIIFFLENTDLNPLSTVAGLQEQKHSNEENYDPYWKEQEPIIQELKDRGNGV